MRTSPRCSRSRPIRLTRQLRSRCCQQRRRAASGHCWRAAAAPSPAAASVYTSSRTGTIAQTPAGEPGVRFVSEHGLRLQCRRRGIAAAAAAARRASARTGMSSAQPNTRRSFPVALASARPCARNMVPRVELAAASAGSAPWRTDTRAGPNSFTPNAGGARPSAEGGRGGGTGYGGARGGEHCRHNASFSIESVPCCLLVASAARCGRGGRVWAGGTVRGPQNAPCGARIRARYTGCQLFNGSQPHPPNLSSLTQAPPSSRT